MAEPLGAEDLVHLLGRAGVLLQHGVTEHVASAVLAGQLHCLESFVASSLPSTLKIQQQANKKYT